MDAAQARLDSKVAVVTGGTQGLGEATARLFEIWHSAPEPVRRVTTAVSTSPASPIAASTSTLAAA